MLCKEDSLRKPYSGTPSQFNKIENWKRLSYVILSMHILCTLFIVLTPLLVLMGKALDWQWISNPVYRKTHIFLLGFIIIEVIFSWTCPLTNWENTCRKKANMDLYLTGFFDYWVERLLKVPFKNWIFNLFFSMISLASILAYVLVPPV